MSQLLLGTPIADRMKAELKQWVSKQDFSQSYVAIIYVGDNPASATYVRMKQQFAQEVGLELKILGQDPKIETYEDLMDTLVELAYDDNCIGMMPQLPLSTELRPHMMEVFDAIPVYKDIDGLGSGFMGAYLTQQIDFLGATPQAVLTLLDEYGYGDVKGKTVSIVGQSNLIGKPLVLAMIVRGATVLSYNSATPRHVLVDGCLQSDIIISCTGVVHLLGKECFRPDQSQVLIDVGRGKKDGRPAGDIDLESIADIVQAYTPVPGGVGPLTIANLLMNIKRLYNKYQ